MVNNLQEIIVKYNIDADTLAELTQKIHEGWVLVAAEENLSYLEKRVRLAEIAGQYASRRMDAVLGGDVQAVAIVTTERVDLTFYFVEQRQYKLASKGKQ